MTARFELTAALEVSNRRHSDCEAMCLALGARAPCEAARLSRRRPQ